MFLGVHAGHIQATLGANILTLIIRLWGLPWKQAIFVKKTTIYEGPPEFFEVYIHISF